jgi:hypothetical protein
MGLAVPVPVFVVLPAEQVTVYPVIALPPLDAGAVKLTVACAFPAVAVTAVGAPGTDAVLVGVTLAAEDAGLTPTALRAVTVQLYVTPPVSPPTVMGLVVPVVAIDDAPAEQTTSYEVIELPPLDDGVANDTTAAPTPAVAVTLSGALGAVAATNGVTLINPLATPVPTLFVAVTEH